MNSDGGPVLFGRCVALFNGGAALFIAMQRGSDAVRLGSGSVHRCSTGLWRYLAGMRCYSLLFRGGLAPFRRGPALFVVVERWFGTPQRFLRVFTHCSSLFRAGPALFG